MASGVAIAGSAELRGAAAARWAGARQLSVPPPLTLLILVSTVPSRLLGSSVRDGVKKAAASVPPTHSSAFKTTYNPGDAAPLRKSVKSQVALVSCDKSTVIFQSPSDPALPFFSILLQWEGALFYKVDLGVAWIPARNSS